MITKKSDGSQVKEKESTDSSTTIEDDDVKGKSFLFSLFLTLLSLHFFSFFDTLTIE